MCQPTVAANPSPDLARPRVRRVEKAVGKDDASWGQIHVEGPECRCRCKACPGACTAKDHASWGLAADTSKRCQDVFDREGKPSSGPPSSSAGPRQPGNWGKTVINCDHRETSLSKCRRDIVCFRLIKTATKETSAVCPDHRRDRRKLRTPDCWVVPADRDWTVRPGHRIANR